MNGEPRSGFASRAAGYLLCLFVFSIPWEKSVQMPGIATLSHLLGILAFATAAVVAARRGSVRPPNLALGLAAVFVLWSGLTYFWSLDRQATVTRVATLAELVAMVWLIWDTCRDSLLQTRLMQAYVWGAVAASASAGLRFFQGQQTYYLRYAAAGVAARTGAMVHTVHNLAAKEVDLAGRLIHRVAFRRRVAAVAVGEQVRRSFRELYGAEPAATIRTLSADPARGNGGGWKTASRPAIF